MSVITWTPRTSSFGSTLIQGVAFGQGMWVAVGSSGLLATGVLAPPLFSEFWTQFVNTREFE